MFCASWPAFGSARLSAASPGVDEHDAIAALDGEDRERDRHVGIGEPCRLQRGLGLFDVGALDEVLVVRLLPETVGERRDLEIADLVFLEAGGRLSMRGADKGDRLREPERRIRGGGAEHEVAT
jgi:hypothetical protein